MKKKILICKYEVAGFCYHPRRGEDKCVGAEKCKLTIKETGSTNEN